MSRNTEEKIITADDIFDLTDKGLDVFKREIKDLTLTSNVLSPTRHENNPSFRVKVSSTSGLYIGVDYTTGEVFNAITLIQKLYNLSFKQAIEKIAADFNITSKSLEYQRIIQPKTEIIIPEEPILYEYQEMKFQKRHHDYWNPGELTEDFLKRNNVYAASKIAANKRVTVIPDDELCFVYVPEDLEYGRLKILRVGSNIEPKDKWRTNIPNEYLWHFYQYENTYINGDLWVIKSLKDELVARLLGIPTISTQSENWQILDKNMERILPLADNIVINYGSDPDGVYKCKMVQEKYGTKYYNTPKAFLPEVNDLFSYVSNASLRQLERHMIAKKLL